MKGGVWVDPKAQKRIQRTDKVFSVRATEAEVAEFDEQIARLGLKRNRALRIAMRRVGGFVEADAATIAELREINRQITGIARNINQIARAANRTHDPDYQAFMEERRGLGKELSRLQSLLQPLFDLAARREDGWARLGKTPEK